ncbi:MAG TPA: hypothetical protein DHN29_23285, partial [Cytophagales bacterium]|nr:hypothetical protein [Cytophagales bacterium]
MLKAIVEDFGNGGTLDGDVTITGDLTVSGGGSLSFDEILEGTQVIDVTSTEAFLVRKNSDDGDVFVVDTTNSRVHVAGTTGLNWAGGGLSYGNVTIGDINGGSSLFVRTADSGSDTYQAGLGIDGTYSSQISTVNVKALGVKYAGFYGNLAFWTSSGVSSTQSMAILGASGNVGINETAPGSLLDMKTTSAASYPLTIRGDIDNDGGYTGIRFGYNGTPTSYLKAAIHVEGTTSDVLPDMHFCLEDTADGTNAALSDAKLSILNGGNVGIGDTNPSEAKLSITGVASGDY